jgi:hypothetical protein
MFRVVPPPIIRSANNYLLLPAAIAAGSSNGVTNTRCCRYSCLRSWWWVEAPPEICRAVSRQNKPCNVASCWTYIRICPSLLIDFNETDTTRDCCKILPMEAEVQPESHFLLQGKVLHITDRQWGNLHTYGMHGKREMCSCNHIPRREDKIYLVLQVKYCSL